MGLDDASLLDESTHELSVVAIDSGGCYLKTFVQMVSDIIPDADCHLLVLWLVVDLSSEATFLIGVIDCIEKDLLLRRRALMALEAPKSAKAMPLPLSSSSILSTQV